MDHMDSKYDCMGKDNNIPKFTLKRKLPPEKLKTTKVRLIEGTNMLEATNLDTAQENGHQKLRSKENIHDARKKLPVYSVRFRLLEEIKKNQTMIVIGETGSGKSTQIPQIIYGAQLQGNNMIAITQPRRVAAITVAMRVAAEMHSEIGSIVGYTVRFEDVSSSKTKIKYLTDGMLLREAMADRLLNKYSVIILDEVHERTVSTDVLFGIVKLAQKERNDTNKNPLKVIIMSATMDVDAFSKYYNNCPVIYLEGRTHPVTIYHSKHKHEDYQYAAVCTIFQLHTTTPPNEDFLIFLTGQEEIETVMYNIKQIAKEIAGPQMQVCPLYAGLPAAKQLQVWKETPSGMRKVILATNIAEASITIPRIKYVIDTGMVKERRWVGATRASRLAVAACARAACWQRAGRAGRDAPGRAFRLYTAADFAARPAHNQPEIVRCPLAPTILLLIAVGIEPRTFPLMNMPPEDSVKTSLALLRELGAIEDESTNPQLTVLGKKMSMFPVDPKYSKIILNAPEFNCLEEILSIVAVLSSESIFHNPMHKREEALKVKQKFISPLGDHITYLNVYKAFCKTTLKKQWCKENYLNQRSLSYASDVRQQLLGICQRLNLNVTSCGQATDQILKCMISGMFMNCAWLRSGAEGGGGAGATRYVTRWGAAAALHPSSALSGARPPPAAVLYSELLHARRAYMLAASAVQPLWLQRPR